MMYRCLAHASRARLDKTIYTSAMPARLERFVPLTPLLGVGACAVDEAPPVIVDAHFENEQVLVVRFSEAIASVEDIEPEAHFRVGSGFYVASLGQTVYYDLAHHFPDDVPGVEGALAESWLRHGFTQVSKVEHGERDDELRLSLSYPLEPYVCDILPEAEALGIPAGIHLHYTQASHPRVRDLAGNELADIAPWWIGSSFSKRNDGAFPELDLRMPIPCPEL